MIGPEFSAFHIPALERQEIRHNILLPQLERMASDTSFKAMTWSLGGPGECAIMMPDKPLLLGEVSEHQCKDLAELTRHVASQASLDLTKRHIGLLRMQQSLALPFTTRFHNASTASSLPRCFHQHQVQRAAQRLLTLMLFLNGLWILSGSLQMMPCQRANMFCRFLKMIDICFGSWTESQSQKHQSTAERGVQPQLGAFTPHLQTVREVTLEQLLQLSWSVFSAKAKHRPAFTPICEIRSPIAVI
jgi:hypothetical protein